MMPNEKFKLMLVMVIIAIAVCLVLWIMAIIGGMNLTNGCFYRYNFDSNGNLISGSSSTNTVVVNASGNYSGTAGINGNVTLDPSAYGQWVNSNLRTTDGQNISFKINGAVSLCRAYVPINNVQQVSNLDVNGNLVPIPRVEEMATPPVSLIMNATNSNWGNLTEIFKNDEYYAALQTEVITTATQSTQYDYFGLNNVNGNCAQGSRTYSPICGRYAIWTPPEQYVSGCTLNLQCYQCNCACYTRGLHLSYWPSDESTCNGASGDWDCDWCSCYEKVLSTKPEPYQNNGQFTIPTQVTNIQSIVANMSQDCSVNPDFINGAYQNQRYMWFSSNIANGLLTRIDTNINPTSQAVTGSNYTLAQIATDQSFYNNSSSYNIIYHEPAYSGGNVGYLQYRLWDIDGNYSDNTGGYVINIRQTKCKRTNGVGLDDIVQGRGWVQYVIVDYDQNPNTGGSNLTPQTINVDANGSGSISVSSSNGGYLWLRIANAPQDYKDSIGQYNVAFTTSTTQGGFFNDVLNPLFEGLKTKIQTASITVFKNMTCYEGASGAGDCTNFFNYIKGMLILYIMFYGMMFLLGNVQINQTDIVIRVIKVGLVAGLMNDNTFEFFSQYVFDFVTNFSDNIIANMSGYSLPSGGVVVSNPFMFMDEVFTKFFLSATFAAQIMALLSMGLNGVLYFIIIFVTIGITIIVGFRAIAVYLMAYLAIAVLIGIAPLFLTFILFERSRYLFDNWVKFTFRYMLEPTVMLAGIIILMQLFTIFLDYVIGYSVCWKCALPFKLPFPSIPGFNPEFLDVPLFCFNWFAPWGFDYMSTPMGINMSNMVILLMLAYCMWGWIEFSSKIVAKLAGGSGGPSATSMGSAMTSPIEQKALAKVGLDSESRAAIKDSMKQRTASIMKGNEESPLKKRADAGTTEVKGKEDATAAKKEGEKETPKEDKKEGHGDKTPPPVPSRDSEEYKKKKQEMMAEQEKDKTSPPLPSSRTREAYKRAVERKKELQEQPATRKPLPPVPPRPGPKPPLPPRPGPKPPLPPRPGTANNETGSGSDKKLPPLPPRPSKVERTKSEGEGAGGSTSSREGRVEIPKTDSQNTGSQSSLGTSGGFTTRTAGIGDRAKNLNAEQKKQFAEKLRSKKPGISEKVERKTDDTLKKEDK